MKKFIKHSAGILGGGAAVLGIINAFIYTKTFGRAKASSPTEKNEKIEELQKTKHEQLHIQSYDGLKLFGRLYAPLSDVCTTSDLDSHTQATKIILAIHGYHATGLDDFAIFSQFYRSHGFYLCLPDDRAHGNSEGKYIGFGYHDRFDCLSWCQYLVERFGNQCSIFLHGISMGAATVMSCCDDDTLPPQVKGIIEDCGYSSGWDQIGHVIRNSLHLPRFPMLQFYNLACRTIGGYSLKDINPIDSVRNTKVPILFIHGDKDKLVPPAMVYKLYNACKGNKRLFIVQDAEHALSYLINPAEYEQTVLSFIKKYDNN